MDEEHTFQHLRSTIVVAQALHIGKKAVTRERSEWGARTGGGTETAANASPHLENDAQLRGVHRRGWMVVPQHLGGKPQRYRVEFASRPQIHCCRVRHCNEKDGGRGGAGKTNANGSVSHHVIDLPHRTAGVEVAKRLVNLDHDRVVIPQVVVAGLCRACVTQARAFLVACRGDAVRKQKKETNVTCGAERRETVAKVERPAQNGRRQTIAEEDVHQHHVDVGALDVETPRDAQGGVSVGQRLLQIPFLVVHPAD